MKTLYCLKMRTEHRWYIGQTPIDRFSTRLDEHRYHRGAKWTTKHGVDRVVWTRPVSDDEVDRTEDEECCKIMCEHGINSCRGGLFNIAADVTRMPVWAKEVYKEKAFAILAASRL